MNVRTDPDSGDLFIYLGFISFKSDGLKIYCQTYTVTSEGFPINFYPQPKKKNHLNIQVLVLGAG